MTKQKPLLTPSQEKALAILAAHGPIRPREFAKKMWPNSEGWQHVVGCGPNGSHRGGGMYQAGGSYLGKLCRQGWARLQYHAHLLDQGRIWREGYTLTPAGREVLLAHLQVSGAAQPDQPAAPASSSIAPPQLAASDCTANLFGALARDGFRFRRVQQLQEKLDQPTIEQARAIYARWLKEQSPGQVPSREVVIALGVLITAAEQGVVMQGLVSWYDETVGCENGTSRRPGDQ